MLLRTLSIDAICPRVVFSWPSSAVEADDDYADHIPLDTIR